MHPILNKKIVLIIAHPDDEAYIFSGTLFENYKRGGQNYIVCATYGEKGTSHLKRKTTQVQLKKIRKNEILRSAKLLHVQGVEFLGLPDANLKSYTNRFFEKTLSYCLTLKPDIVLSFGPDGISGHRDHVTAGKIAERIAKRLQLPLFTATFSKKVASQAISFLRTRRRRGEYHDAISHSAPDIKILINGRKKLQALRLHTSQLDENDPFIHFPEFAKKEFLHAEHFARRV